MRITDSNRCLTCGDEIPNGCLYCTSCIEESELEQKAKEYSQHLYHSKEWNPCEDMLVKAYLTGAKECQLTTGMVIQEDVLRLRIENEQLKAQIEKMKCCDNCDNYLENPDICDACKKYSNWVLAE